MGAIFVCVLISHAHHVQSATTTADPRLIEILSQLSVEQSSEEVASIIPVCQVENGDQYIPSGSESNLCLSYGDSLLDIQGQNETVNTTVSYCMCPETLGVCSNDTTNGDFRPFCTTEYFASGLLMGGEPSINVRLNTDEQEEDENNGDEN